MRQYTKFVFFERVPFMGVELLDLVDDYVIASYGRTPEQDLLSDQWNVIARAPTGTDVPENDEAVRRLVSDETFARMVRAGARDCKGICFFMNQPIEDAFQRAGIPIALPPYDLQAKLGSKANLQHICAEAHVPANDTCILDSREDSETLFSKCRGALGHPFIVQGSFGVSGEDTCLIDCPEDLRRFRLDVPGVLRASRYIQSNIPLSLHLCVSRRTILVRGPFLQLIGLDELSNNPFQFCGNDTSQSLLDPAIGEAANEIGRRLGAYVAAAGYAGILGVDILWDVSRGSLFVQELNTRLVGLTRLLSGAQKDLGVRPDLLEHLAQFGHPNLTRKGGRLTRSEARLLDGSYSQLLISNKAAREVPTRSVKPGIYNHDRGALEFVRSDLFLDAMRPDQVMLAYTPATDRHSSPDSLLTRVLLKRSVLRSDAYALDGAAAALIDAVRSHVLVAD